MARVRAARGSTKLLHALGVPRRDEVLVSRTVPATTDSDPQIAVSLADGTSVTVRVNAHFTPEDLRNACAAAAGVWQAEFFGVSVRDSNNGVDQWLTADDYDDISIAEVSSFSSLEFLNFEF